MKQHPSPLKLAAYAVLYVLLFFGLLQITFQSRGTVFILEAIGTAGLALLVFAGCWLYRRNQGENLFFAVFLLIIANLLLLRAFTGALYVVMLLLAFVGFLFSIPKRSCQQKEYAQKEEQHPKREYAEKSHRLSPNHSPNQEEPHSLVFDTKESSSEKRSEKREKKNELKNENTVEDENKPAGKSVVSVAFTPGKYVASSRGNVYHEAKCDWAKKVSKTHRLWFNSKKEAEDKNYKSHGCVG